MTGYTIAQELTDATLDNGSVKFGRKSLAVKTARQMATEKRAQITQGVGTDVHAFVVCDCSGQCIAAFKTGAKMGAHS